MYEWAVLRDMLSRLEVILDDEDVPREVADRGCSGLASLPSLRS